MIKLHKINAQASVNARLPAEPTVASALDGEGTRCILGNDDGEGYVTGVCRLVDTFLGGRGLCLIPVGVTCLLVCCCARVVDLAGADRRKEVTL